MSVFSGMELEPEPDDLLPVFVVLRGLPDVCPSCGERPASEWPGAWPISTFGNRLAVECPECHVIVAPILATPER